VSYGPPICTSHLVQVDLDVISNHEAVDRIQSQMDRDQPRVRPQAQARRRNTDPTECGGPRGTSVAKNYRECMVKRHRIEQTQMAAPKYTDLEKLALEHGGYFDRPDAQSHGVGDVALRRGLAKGRYERIYPGVYRLAIAPTSSHDELFLAWIWSNYRGVISYESALALYGLSDLLPSQVHISVPLDFRRASGPFRTHRLREPLSDRDRTVYEGLPVTTAARSIVDAAAEGADPEQIGKAIDQSIGRGLTTAEQVLTLARRPHYLGRRVALPLLEGALTRAAA
jgi:predicted transcriptional regulator of viral defense system